MTVARIVSGYVTSINKPLGAGTAPSTHHLSNKYPMTSHFILGIACILAPFLVFLNPRSEELEVFDNDETANSED